MIAPAYDRWGVTVHEGDCLDVLRQFPDEHFAAVVTDPPYNLSFMGREWDAHESPLAFQRWCEGWARECLRVLKPGGMMLSFGGTRTVHRLTCGIEDAGFEIRDGIDWLYAGGMPKGINVSKAIDRMAGAEREVIGRSSAPSGAARVYTQDAWTRANRSTMGVLSAPATDEARQWEGWNTQLRPSHEPIICARKPFNVVPSWEVVNTTHHAIGALLWLSLCAAKRAELSSQSAPAGSQGPRCVSALVAAAIATSPEGSARTGTFGSPELESTSVNIASSWNAILGVLSNQARTFTTETASGTTTALRTLNSLLTPLTSPTTMPPCGCLLDGETSPATVAAGSSSDAWWNWIVTLSHSAPESAIEGIAVAACSVLAMVAAELTSDPAVGSTAPGSATTARPGSGSSPAHAVTADSCTGRVAEPGSTAPSDAQGSHRPVPAHEPIIVARKPFPGTVASNVLEHGTGGINVDATRVAADGRPLRVPHGPDTPGQSTYGSGLGGSRAVGDTDQGRWPPNVVLSHVPSVDPATGDVVGDACADECVDGCPVRELDQQSGVLTSGNVAPGGFSGPYKAEVYGRFARNEIRPDTVYADSGGASRFMPCFRHDADFPPFIWSAKAPTHERPRVAGESHNTVKPLALMRWLVRLVTPPGGTVLDCFAGSGSTGQAARAEGFQAVLIDSDPAAIPWIVARLDAHPREDKPTTAQPAARQAHPDLFDGDAS